MRIHKLILLATSVGLTTTFLFASGGSALPAKAASPLVQVGPKAVLANNTSADYGLFTCQIVGLNSGGTCYDPYQIRHAYGIDTLIQAGYTGSKKTIVIVDAFQSPNIVAQLNTFNTFYGLPSLNGLGNASNPNLGTFNIVAPDGLTAFVPGNANITGWAEEISLDVLWAHAIAPGANITLVLAKSDADVDILSATTYAVKHRLGDVISQSFGENESCVDSGLLEQEHDLFAEATLKQITLFASAGDSGAAERSCDGTTLVKAASSPASDPLVSAVGGTQLHAALYCLTTLGCDSTANPPAGTYQSEVVWNEPYGAGGGGFSVLYPEPLFQEGVLFGGKHRGVPDVAYNASVEFGVLTYLDIPGVPAGFYAFGGTSAGSPQWAALTAIADEKAGYPLGFINAGAYKLNLSRHTYAESFHDITSGNNSFGGIVGFNAGPGWDATTGLGSPRAETLVDNLLRSVSPFDGILEVAYSELQSNGFKSGPRKMDPH